MASPRQVVTSFLTKKVTRSCAGQNFGKSHQRKFQNLLWFRSYAAISRPGGKFTAPFGSMCVNRSIRDGTFPSSQKCAIVTPILKKKLDPLEYDNYRPVSNLSFISKIFERAIYESYMEEDLVACIVDSVDEIMTAFPSALITLAGDLTNCLTKLLLNVQAWSQLLSNRQGEPHFWIEFTCRCRAMTMYKLSPQLSKA